MHDDIPDGELQGVDDELHPIRSGQLQHRGHLTKHKFY